jgi:hypothetical protein
MSDQVGGTLEVIAHIVTALMGTGLLGVAVWAFKIGVFKQKFEEKQKDRDDQADRIEDGVKLLGTNHIAHLEEKMDSRFEKLTDTIRDGNDRIVDAILKTKI